MKLLTKLIRTPGYTDGYGDQYELTRDAAMAHALVMTWSEAKDTHCCSYREYDEFLKERTAEIMCEWGYSE